jgi:hypothetical protein
MEAATARAAPATRPAPRRKPRRKAPRKTGRSSNTKRVAPSGRPLAYAERPRIKRRARPAKSSARATQAPAGRLIRPAMAGAALFPQAAMRSAGAVRDFSDSGLIVRLTRGRGWIAVLCALLGGIVALNVLSLSLTAGSGRTSLQIDELKTEVSTLQAQIEERLSAVKVEAEAARLGLANPDPKAITFLSARDADARRVAHLLATDGFLLAPSQPSSYPAPGTSYAPVPTAAPSTTTTETTSAAPTATVPPSTAPPTSGGAGDVSSGSGTPSSGSSSGSSTGTTGGVGL